MIANAWIALALGAAFMVGGVATVSAAGNMLGDCDQLRDGSCGDCPDLADDVVVEDDACDSCNDYDFLYGETELEPPHQSACGQV